MGLGQPEEASRGALRAVFTATIFFNALLLFLVQPIVGKVLLPLLGGSPSVWNTCMVFFQALLLAGYSYAHLAARWLSWRAQLGAQALLLLSALWTLPIGLSTGWLERLARGHDPALWTLGALALMVGAPFLALSSQSPLLQRWFSRTDHPDAANPYFLYAASNAGSMLALLMYPLLWEPWLGLEVQRLGWSAGYGVVVLLSCACGALAHRRLTPGAARADRASEGEVAPLEQGARWEQRLRWVGLAALPSSLMLGVTSFLTTDVASAPLLWIVPLTLYLLTFILVFATRPVRLGPKAGRAVSLAAIVMVVLIGMEGNSPAWLIMTLHLLFFFAATLLSHGRLASLAPPATRLTEYFFWVSLGGVCGGLFNALLAPLVFSTVLEYPLMIALVPLARESVTQARSAAQRRRAWLERAAQCALVVGLVLGGGALARALNPGDDATLRQLLSALAFIPAALVVLARIESARRTALSLATLTLVVTLAPPMRSGQLELRERNFFGVVRVVAEPQRDQRVIYHGTTVHGAQSLSRRDRCEPLAYYHPQGPAGDVFAARQAPWDVGVIGLGAGALACYGGAGERWDLYEIDPAVVRVARDPERFTFLSQSPTTQRFLVGDGRLMLARAQTRYDLLVLDAFSSDVVPVHLLTLEAFTLYQAHIKPDGAILAHVSNRYFWLPPVIAAIAQALGLHVIMRDDRVAPEETSRSGRYASTWVLISPQPRALPGWSSVAVPEGARVWTDSYADLLSTLSR